jgi:flagellum-specific ATP synthase
MAGKNHYPAIDVLASVSRVMSDIVTKDHKTQANEIKKNMAVYADAEDLINIGAYAKGSNPEIDLAIEKNPAIKSFLQQATDEKFSFEETRTLMEGIVGQ